MEEKGAKPTDITVVFLRLQPFRKDWTEIGDSPLTLNIFMFRNSL